MTKLALSTMKLLLIERKQSIIDLITDLLENTHYQLVIADSGHEAINLLKQDTVDIICSSLYLSDTDALNLCQQIRNDLENLNTPYILLTASKKEQVLNRALDAGITEVISKLEVAQLTAYLDRINKNHQALKGNVLLVEDSLALSKPIVNLLRQQGLKVIAVDYVEDAWKQFQKHDFQLVITDIMLVGEQTGQDLVNRIRNESRDTPYTAILVMTGFDNIARRIDLLSRGIDDYISKPVNFDELSIRVRQLMNKSQILRELDQVNPSIKNIDHEKNALIEELTHHLKSPIAKLEDANKLLTQQTESNADQKILIDTLQQAHNELSQQLNKLTQSSPNHSEVEQNEQQNKVLYIEDNKVNHLLMKKYLQQLGQPLLLQAYSAEEGLELAQKERPQVIYLDINLPQMNGWQAAQHLKDDANTHHIPIIAISGTELKKEQEVESEKYFSCWLQKPFNADQLKNILTQISH